MSRLRKVNVLVAHAAVGVQHPVIVASPVSQVLQAALKCSILQAALIIVLQAALKHRVLAVQQHPVVV